MKDLIIACLLIMPYAMVNAAYTELSFMEQNDIIGGSSSSNYYDSCGNAKYGGGSASCPNHKLPSPCTNGIHEVCNDENSAFWCGSPNECDTCKKNKKFKCNSYRGEWYSFLGACYRSGTHSATGANCQANDGKYHDYTCK